ncbi:four helix bundle protein [Flagellimonas meishanensis]|uniref:four helix bundle protein n=1 Tax=Flagellimonas meishanensis TaxID=2873264 RepID=UPI001CA74DCA|nr:four helix bundle protein [[Muricauda] meishanensis]
MKEDNLIVTKTFDFSLAIIELFKTLKVNKEFVLSKQLLRSGTSIGANVNEATAAQSKKDFIHKMAIASKEARETKYWLYLLNESKLGNVSCEKEIDEINSIINILTKIVKTSQENLKIKSNI